MSYDNKLNIYTVSVESYIHAGRAHKGTRFSDKSNDSAIRCMCLLFTLERITQQRKRNQSDRRD